MTILVATSKLFQKNFHQNCHSVLQFMPRKKSKQDTEPAPSVEFVKEFAQELNTCTKCLAEMTFDSPRFFCNKCFSCFCLTCLLTMQCHHIKNLYDETKCEKCNHNLAINEEFFLSSLLIFQVRKIIFY